ncbi:MAG TPA: pseudouridine synthase [Candidatus Sulfomarinibacteraceae bacterium]|nr:pseudouridine synthase [Candidatus Sulfomarinibacteraceae bacterium]
MADDGGAPVRPSTVTLPEVPPDGATTLLDFFAQRFPRIPAAVWAERFAAGRIWTDDGPVAADDPYRPLLVVHYRREVEREPPVRTDFRVVWSDRHLLVVDKPPNLPVTPGGRWVRGCLLHLLAEATGTSDIVPLHRLDRLTSGLVLLSVDPASRSHYGRLFQPEPLLQKTYTAVSEVLGEPPSGRFTLDHHIARCRDRHWRQVVHPGLPANARCEVEVLQAAGGLALLRLRPTTGRKHQLRVQLAQAGLPILGDPLYGTSPSHGPDDGSRRLWLDAHLLSVHGFPRADGGVLDAEWTSARPPEELWRRALEQARWSAPRP